MSLGLIDMFNKHCWQVLLLNASGYDNVLFSTSAEYSNIQRSGGVIGIWCADGCVYVGGGMCVCVCVCIILMSQK